MKLKKPKFWDYEKPNLISNILFPISKIFEIFANIKKRKTNIKNIKTICVGNIYLGGTGKTSISIELKKILDGLNIKSCFIKKYYKNQKDEQNLLKKFGKVFVDKSRLKALENANLEKYQVAIFDDGLQDKNLNYDLSFVCFNKKNFIGNGRMIPSGPLRENLNKLNKYKNIFLNGNDENKKNLIEKITHLKSNLNIYESKYIPLNINDFNLNENYIIFSGIGNHQTFVDMLKINKFIIIKNFEYPDHYDYTKNDIDNLKKIAMENNAKIVTTEKDYLRLNIELRKNINYLAVYLKIDEIEEISKKLILLLKNENY